MQKCVQMQKLQPISDFKIEIMFKKPKWQDLSQKVGGIEKYQKEITKLFITHRCFS